MPLAKVPPSRGPWTLTAGRSTSSTSYAETINSFIVLVDFFWPGAGSPRVFSISRAGTSTGARRPRHQSLSRRARRRRTPLPWPKQRPSRAALKRRRPSYFQNRAPRTRPASPGAAAPVPGRRPGCSPILRKGPCSPAARSLFCGRLPPDLLMRRAARPRRTPRTSGSLLCPS